MKSTNPFDWFELELATIKSQRFHVFEVAKPDDLQYKGPLGSVILTGDFAEFLSKFGRAMLFTDHQDAPILHIYPLKEFRRHICGNGLVYIGFGCRSYQSVYFDEQELLSSGCSKVYVVNQKAGREIAPSFSVWLKDAYEWSRSKYSATKWRKIIEGPKPFSFDEMQIVEARKQFKWKLTGFAEDGDALFEVENNSTRKLPYLSIGIQGKGGTILVGGAWLDVSQIEPGEKAIIKKDCYKYSLPTSELEAFEKPEPVPEKKDAYWEFGKPK